MEVLNVIIYAKKYVKYRNYKYFLEYERVQDDSLL